MRGQEEKMEDDSEKMRAAIVRQIENINLWLKTGIPADAEESESIYNQLRESIGLRPHITKGTSFTIEGES